MGRSPCCEKSGLKKGPWTPEEDQKLLAYIEEYGHGSWRALPAKAGLQRCGKSCRLRWTNYLRPDIKRGKFSLQEEQTIIQLHALLGNRWSAIATHLPKRTDNEIKNYWNTHLKKRLAKMGIDPVTHKPTGGTLGCGTADGHSAKAAANLSHMAQWESARLEAEARLARESKIRAAAATLTSPPPFHAQSVMPTIPAPFDMLHLDLESPTSTLTFGESNGLMLPITRTDCTRILDSNRMPMHIFETKERPQNFTAGDEHWLPGWSCMGAGYTGMLVDRSEGQNSSNCCAESANGQEESCSQVEDEDNRCYWNGLLDFINPPTLPSTTPSIF